MEICIIHRNLFQMQSTIAVNMFDVHILSFLSNSMVLAKDSVDHFHNDIFGKCHHYSVMLDCYSIQTYKTKNKMRKKNYSQRFVESVLDTRIFDLLCYKHIQSKSQSYVKFIINNFTS